VAAIDLNFINDFDLRKHDLPSLPRWQALALREVTVKSLLRWFVMRSSAAFSGRCRRPDEINQNYFSSGQKTDLRKRSNLLETKPGSFLETRYF
jgi:hypothetical protein